MGTIIKGLANEISVYIHAKITLDLGKTEKIKFKAKFKKLEKLEAEQKISDMNNPDTDVTPESIIADDLLSWEDMRGEGGDVEFTDENLQAVLGSIEYVAALFDGWGKAQLGSQMAKAKN